ncbi:hypothetical protein PRK78_007338 [Emydomyces testavorans]|uniref:Uncharacterized protein n=1 Tax=Emydomyces testavorans TaxID=2070801 RepID=A0AAF0IMK7_9EURO|nr:hypothetical protein PRK78_007338 [Emydomyces testavorans]
MDEEEYLQRALEENLRLHEQRQQSFEETQRRQREAEERLLRESEAAAARARRVTDDEDDQLRLAMERSAADEEARTRRIQEERERLLQLDREFGSGSGSRNGHRRSGNENMASAHGRSTPPARSRSHAPTRQEHITTAEETRQPRRQNTIPSITGPSSSSQPRQRSTVRETALSHMNSFRQSLSRRRSSAAAAAAAVAPHNSYRPRRQHSTNQFTPRNPAAYSLDEIYARSLNDAFPRGPFRPRGADAVFEAALQAAINESAQQTRDEEEEAVRRSRGVPTYEEACRMPRYRAPRGATYVFQGPKEVVIENGNGEGEEMRVKVVGEMDLAEAMRVANQNFRQGGGRE